MRRKPLIIARIVAIVLLALLTVTIIVMHRDNTALRRALSERGTVVFSPDLCRLILSDLESNEARRIDPWKSYFRRCLDLASNRNVNGFGPDEMLELYRIREQPARSNYFSDLLFALNAKQASVGLTKKELLSCLGPPDESQDVDGCQFMRYRFWHLGRESIAIIRATNNTVLGVGFNLIDSGYK